MASIIPGYEYDIFISYRHKDDKYDHWVTDFVSNLRRELEATFREEISIYIDSNQRDGLLMTYDVDESLKHKLKSLVFIPVISHTYCDPSSFAWANEFRAFVEQASSDKYSLKLRLQNGNIASRVLPVIIHDLPEEEKILCEKVLGTKLRGIEFIYSEPGVNRPLRFNEDNPHDNLAKTTYRNQINKLANAVKEIITAIGLIGHSSAITYEDSIMEKNPYKNIKRRNLKILIACLIGLLLVTAIYFFGSGFSGTKMSVEKSVAVLPFRNLGDPKNDYFGEGMMQAILDHLFMIDSLKIPEARSSLKYKTSNLSTKEIARKLNVSFLLTGDYKISPNKISINIRLLDAKKDKTLTQEYIRKEDVMDYIDIQSDIAHKIANKLQVTIELSVLERMSSLPTKINDAYSLYLKAVSIRLKDPFLAKRMLEEAISLDSTFAQAYAQLAIQWIYLGGYPGVYSRKEVLENAEPLVKTALRLDSNLQFTHIANGAINLDYRQNFKSVDDDYNTVKKLSPSNTEAISWFEDYLLAMGRAPEALSNAEKAFQQNDSISDNWVLLALAYSFIGMSEKAVATILKAAELFPDDDNLLLNAIRILDYSGKYKEAVELYNKRFDSKNPNHNIPWFKGVVAVACYSTGDEVSAKKYLDELLILGENSSKGSPSFYAATVYASMNKKEEALQMLEKAYDTKEVELYWLKVDPLFKTLHGDPRFTVILNKIGF